MDKKGAPGARLILEFSPPVFRLLHRHRTSRSHTSLDSRRGGWTAADVDVAVGVLHDSKEAQRVGIKRRRGLDRMQDTNQSSGHQTAAGHAAYDIGAPADDQLICE